MLSMIIEQLKKQLALKRKKIFNHLLVKVKYLILLWNAKQTFFSETKSRM